jgi:Fe-Mn family superoxide dismutase
MATINKNMEDSIKLYKHIINEAQKMPDKLEQDKLPVADDALAPVLSKDTIDYHFKKLAAKYVERYNKGEGDKKFNRGGAVLHNYYFGQLMEPGTRKPTGKCKEIIEKKYKTFETFKEAVEKLAMSIQGSGWIYMDSKGRLDIIHNHEYNDQDIVLIIDWWEHAWALDYQADKAKYLKNFWRIIDWESCNRRMSA